MKTVSDLDQDHACIIADRKKELADILCLEAVEVLRYLFGRDLCESLNDLGNLVSEPTTYILDCIFGVLNDIM